MQVEYHPHYLQEELKPFCDSQGIHFQAYSSLGTTVKESPLLQDPVVASVATKYSVSPAQVLLRWTIQQGIGKYREQAVFSVCILLSTPGGYVLCTA